MRLSVLLSLLVHAGLVALTLVAWPSGRLDDAMAVEVVPIDIVIGDVTDVAATAPPLPENPPPEEAEPEPEEAAAEEPPEPEAPRAAAPQQRRERLDVSDLRRRLLTNRDQTETGVERPDNARDGPSVREGAGRSQAETADLLAYFAAIARNHIDRNQCWTDPVGRLDSAELQIYVTVRLTRAGRIEYASRARSGGGGSLPRAVLEDAERAARACAPYPFPDDPNGPANYDLWRQIELCFGSGCR